MNPSARLFTPSTDFSNVASEGNIDVTQLREVDFWAGTLGVSEAELRIAVAAVGTSAQDVRDHLGR